MSIFGNKSHKRATRILVLTLVFAILCTSLPYTPVIPAQAAQNEQHTGWYSLTSRINSSWGGHIAGEITLTNISSQTKNDWQIALTWAAQITSMWNATYEQTEDQYIIHPLDYNRELASGAQVTMGFLAEGEDSVLCQLVADDYLNGSGVSVTDAWERENMTPVPSEQPGTESSGQPSETPTAEPVTEATSAPTVGGSAEPDIRPTPEITVNPTETPVTKPTSVPSTTPAVRPTTAPTTEVTTDPVIKPTAVPSIQPTTAPTATPTIKPTGEPTVKPTDKPTASPGIKPPDPPTPAPVLKPTVTPVVSPTPTPTATPTIEPTGEPTTAPTAEPTPDPAIKPTEDLCIYTDTIISQDLTCRNLILMGGSLSIRGCTLTVQQDYFQNGGNCAITDANLHILGSARIITGELAAKNASLQICGEFLSEQAKTITLEDSSTTIGEDFTYAAPSTLGRVSQRGGELHIGGNLTIQSGGFNAFGRTKTNIAGDLRIDGGDFNPNVYVKTVSDIMDMNIGGDLIFNSGGWSRLYLGQITLHGNLIQTDRATAKSLVMADNFLLKFCGTETQKIELSHPETAALGIMDFREASAVEIPDILCGGEIRGFSKIKKKQHLQLALSDMELVQDETIDCQDLEWSVGKLTGTGCSLTIPGNLTLHVSKEFTLRDADFTADNLLIDGAGSVRFRKGTIRTDGNITCAAAGGFGHDSGELYMGGDLTVQAGECILSNDKTEIAGDVRISGQGSLTLKDRQTEVSGDLQITSLGESYIDARRLLLHGNLIQTEEAAWNSLETGERCHLVFCGESTQKIETVYPSTTLGIMDFRGAVGVEVPDRLKGTAVYGLSKIGTKEFQQLELSDMELVQDEEIHCGSLEWIGSNLYVEGYSLTVQGNMTMRNGGRLSIKKGALTADNLNLDGIRNAFCTEAVVGVSGNMDCASANGIVISLTEMQVGNNLTISKGGFSGDTSADIRVGGDVRITGQGSLGMDAYSREDMQMEVSGDLQISSQKQSLLENGQLLLCGNLIQKEEASSDSLAVSEEFLLTFYSNQPQKIDLAYPESSTLGTMDFRKTSGIEVPDILRGKQVIDFAKIGRKDTLRLELSGMTLIQDEMIDCKQVEWIGGSLTGNGYDFTVRGDLTMRDGGHLNLREGNFTVGNLTVDGLDYAGFQDENIGIGGDFNCTIQRYFDLYDGSMHVGGDLTIRDGSFSVRSEALAKVDGDVCITGQGKAELSWGIDQLEMQIAGDLYLDSTERILFSSGKILLQGDLIQTEKSAPNSLTAGEDFVLVFCGHQKQRIQLAHPETVNLGNLDLRKAVKVEVPDLLRARQACGLSKIAPKSFLQLNLSNMILVQDEVIHCDHLEWTGAKTSGMGYDFTVTGDLTIREGEVFSLKQGNFAVKNFTIDQIDYVTFMDVTATVEGDFLCAARGSFHQQSGEMHIIGNLVVSNGCYESYYAAETEIEGDVRIIEQGEVLLTDPGKSEMTVGGDLLVNSRKTSVFSGGKLSIRGNLTQIEDEETDNLRMENLFCLELCGDKIQAVSLPGVDEIPDLDLRKCKAVSLDHDYEGYHLYGLDKIVQKGDDFYSYFDFNTVTADTVLNGDFYCGGELSIGDCSLTVTGNFRQKGKTSLQGGSLTVGGSYTAVRGSLWISGGFVHVGGNMSVQKEAGLWINGDPDSHLRVDGNLSTASGNAKENCFATGTLEVRGNLTQQKSACDESIRMTTTKLVLSGDRKQVVTLRNLNGESYLHDVDLTGAAGVEFVCAGLSVGNIAGMEKITNKLLTIRDCTLTLQQNETFYGELALENMYLDCNGNRLQVGGSLTQTDTICNLHRGALHVGEDYHIMGNSILQMICWEDRVYVGGSFATASTMSHATVLRSGRMEVMGGFDQSGNVDSFQSSEFFTIAFLGSGTHKVHFMEKKKQYFANVDPDFDDVEYTDDSISVSTLALHIGIGMVKGLEEALLNPEIAAVAMALLAIYGITAAILPTNYVLIAVELFSIVIAVVSVYSMLKAGDELGDALNGDYSEEEKAEKFGKAAIMLILAAGFLYGSLTMVLHPKVLESNIEFVRETIRMDFSEILVYAKIAMVYDLESLIRFAEEYVSTGAQSYLWEAAQECNVRQLHQLAKMVRNTSKEVGRALMEDELAVAVENWRVTGKIKEAAQAVVDWIKLKQLAANRKNLKYKEVNIHGKTDSELDAVDLVNQVIFEDKSAKKIYMDNPDCPQTEGQWAEKHIFRKGSKRIKAISQEEYTLSIKDSNDLPDIDQLKSIRKYVFVIEEDTYALRQAVENSLSKLRWKYPEYEFWAIYGGK